MAVDRETYQDDIASILSGTSGKYDVENISLKEAETTIGLSWTSVAHIYPSPKNTIGQTQMLMNQLRYKGYTPLMEKDDDGEVRIEVGIRYDAFERLQ